MKYLMADGVTPPRACARLTSDYSDLYGTRHSPARVCEAARGVAASFIHRCRSLPRARVRGCKA